MTTLPPPVQPTEVTDFSNPNLLGVLDIDYNDVGTTDPNAPTSASAIYLGGGFVLTAAHNFAVNVLRPDLTARNFEFLDLPGQVDRFGNVINENRGVTSLEGESTAVNLTPVDNPMGVRNGDYFSWGNQLHDTAIFRVSPVASSIETVDPRIIVYVDPQEASGELYIAGYPGQPFDNETLYEETGTLVDNQHNSGLNADLNATPFSNGTGFTGWNVDGVDFSIRPGMSGGPVWLTTDDDFAPTGQFLAGTLSGGFGAGAGLPGSFTTIEDIGGSYDLIANHIFGGLSSAAADTLANEFGTHVLIAEQIKNDPTDVINNTVNGTGFNEDIYTSSFTTIVNGGGGKDTIYLNAADHSRLQSFSAGNGTVTFENTSRVITYNSIEAIGLAGATHPTGLDFNDTTTIFNALQAAFTTAVNLISNSSFTPISAQAGTVTLVGQDISPIVLSALGFTGEEEIDGGYFKVPIGNVLSGVLSGLGVSTVDNFVIDFGPSVAQSSVSQEQIGNDLVLNYIESGVSKTMTLQDVYADGNADEIVGLTFDDASVEVDLADIDITAPPPPPIVGTNGYDVLTGTDGNDIINALAGNDHIIGSQGADQIDGGAGFDLIDYRSSSSGVTVSFVSNTGSGGDAQGDTYTSIERVYGSQFADVMTGDAGNNNFFSYGGDDIINAGAGTDYVRGGAGADQMDGGDGRDYLDYRGSSAAVDVNLATGAASGGDAQGDTFTNFEYLLGSSFDDVLTGDHTNNFLYGYSGDDVINGGGGHDLIRGGAGADILDGGSGIDWLVYRLSTSGISVNLLTGASSGGYAQGDVFSNFERVQGSNYDDNITGDNNNNLLYGYNGNDIISGEGGNDILTGHNGDDQLFGGDGVDQLRGGAGADVLDGGASFDYADYQYDSSGVTANLANSALNTGDAAGDSYINIEGLLGHRTFADNLTGDSGNNQLFGYGGDDVLNGGDGHDILRGGTGADVLNGGAGIDTADYRGAASGVTVNLASQTASGGEAQGDTLISIERAYGSHHIDTLTGNDSGNLLYGYNGNDIIDGAGGNDFIRGGNGNDTIYLSGGADTIFGGAGNDTFILLFNAFDGSTIRDFAQGDIIDLTTVVANGEFGGVTNLSALLSYASQSGNHVVLDFDGAAVTLFNTTLDSLDAGDFIFGQGNPFPPFPPGPFDPNDPDYYGPTTPGDNNDGLLDMGFVLDDFHALI